MSGENVGPVGPPLNCKRLEIRRSNSPRKCIRPPSDRRIHKGAWSSTSGERFHQYRDSRGQQEL